jgi:hypothetical protein
MQERLPACRAAPAAIASSQGKVDAPNNPAHDKRNMSRRENSTLADSFLRRLMASAF